MSLASQPVELGDQQHAPGSARHQHRGGELLVTGFLVGCNFGELLNNLNIPAGEERLKVRPA